MKVYQIRYADHGWSKSLYDLEIPNFVEALTILEATSKVSKLHPDMLQVVMAIELVSDSPVVR